MYDMGEQFHLDISCAKSNPESTIKGNNYRITVLTERLLRLEYSPSGMFTEVPTQLVLNRSFTKPEFNIVQDNKYLEISTKYFKLSYTKESAFSSSALRVQPLIGDKDNIWYYGFPEVKTYASILGALDDKRERYTKGIYSLDGFASIDDSSSLVLDENGNFSKKKNETIDIYLFVYGDDFDLALKDYFELTGKPDLIPRYALGNWWSKNYPYSENELYKLFNKFVSKEVPISILLMDNPWHLSDGKHISGYTFNKNKIKDPNTFINNIHKYGVRLGLNINPTDGVLPFEEQYQNVIKYIQTKENTAVTFAPLDPKFIDVFLKMIIHPLDNMGIDFYWLDYTNNDVLPHYMMSRYMNIDSGRTENKRSMMLNRSTSIAPHKSGILYSGRTKVSFDTLRNLAYVNTSASNLGVSWWSHDIGGYTGGTEDKELYSRYMEFGCFSPIFRISSDIGRYYKREPWKWDPSTYSIAKNYMQLRNKLVPYTYSMAYRYREDAIPIVDPLYHKQKDLYYHIYYKNEYMFGSEFLIAPIIGKKDPLMDRVIHDIYLPEGIWYDFKTGKRYPGNRSYASFYRDSDYPVFAKAGAIIPMSVNISNQCALPTDLEIHVFPKQSNSFILYEDDGVTNLYKSGFFLKTLIDYNYQENNYTLIIRAKEGKSGIAPDTRNYKIRFRNTLKTDEVVANYNGLNIDCNTYVEDNDFIVEVKNVGTTGQLSINCKGKALENDPVMLINEDIDDIISDLELETVIKDKIAGIMFGTLPIKKKRIEIRKLKKDKIDRKFIKMFLKLLEYVEQV